MIARIRAWADRRLVPGWHTGWRWLSVHFIVFALGLKGAMLWMGDDLRGLLPPTVTQWASTIALAGALMARFWKQKEPKP